MGSGRLRGLPQVLSELVRKQELLAVGADSQTVSGLIF